MSGPLFIKLQTLAQAFSCAFWEISKNTFFTEHLRATASITLNLSTEYLISTERFKCPLLGKCPITEFFLAPGAIFKGLLGPRDRAMTLQSENFMLTYLISI